jgi:hypothetical protein
VWNRSHRRLLQGVTKAWRAKITRKCREFTLFLGQEKGGRRELVVHEHLSFVAKNPLRQISSEVSLCHLQVRYLVACWRLHFPTLMWESHLPSTSKERTSLSVLSADMSLVMFIIRFHVPESLLFSFSLFGFDSTVAYCHACPYCTSIPLYVLTFPMTSA